MVFTIKFGGYSIVDDPPVMYHDIGLIIDITDFCGFICLMRFILMSNQKVYWQLASSTVAPQRFSTIFASVSVTNEIACDSAAHVDSIGVFHLVPK